MIIWCVDVEIMFISIYKHIIYTRKICQTKFGTPCTRTGIRLSANTLAMRVHGTKYPLSNKVSSQDKVHATPALCDITYVDIHITLNLKHVT